MITTVVYACQLMISLDACKASLVFSRAIYSETDDVTDDVQTLTATAPRRVAVLAVDTACQVPMQTVKCSTSKAYIFRSATEKPRKERMDSMPYSDSGMIARIAPYAPQGGTGAAAGAEDHPDAEGALTFVACVLHVGHGTGLR